MNLLPFILSNPAGFWALLGIPAVLLIHFLQRKAKVVEIATLFLLEQTQRESTTGRRFERLMNSVPLWMQILGVILLTWLLVEPRYPKEKSVQRIAIVLDASASMEVFRDALAERLAEEIPDLLGPASSAEFTLLESLPGGLRLYAGPSSKDLLAAIRAWKPRAGTTDPTHALRLARSIVSREGIVLYATDTPLSLPPFGAVQLSVGEPIPNVGFTGVSTERRDGALVWQALVRNDSKSPATRTWWVEAPDGTAPTKPRTINIAPGAMTRIQAALPADDRRIVVRLSPDRFPLDDSLPLLRPRPKPLSWSMLGSDPAFTKSARRLLSAVDALEPAPSPDRADLLLCRVAPSSPAPPRKSAIVIAAGADKAPALEGGIVAAPDPLIAGLNWQPLIARKSPGIAAQPSDAILLRQGRRPLILLRTLPAAAPGERPARQLIFNFDLTNSNALRLPALAVLVHRFCKEIRDAKPAPLRALLETAQPIRFAASPNGPEISVRAEALDSAATESTLPAAARIDIETPSAPGFLTVRQGPLTLLDAAVHFGDTREADFSRCAPIDTLAQATRAATIRHTREDHWWRAWFLALLLALVVSWRYGGRRKNPDSRIQKQETRGKTREE
jgi:hypothetical protein